MQRNENDEKRALLDVTEERTFDSRSASINVSNPVKNKVKYTIKNIETAIVVHDEEQIVAEQKSLLERLPDNCIQQIMSYLALNPDLSALRRVSKTMKVAVDRTPAMSLFLPDDQHIYHPPVLSSMAKFSKIEIGCGSYSAFMCLSLMLNIFSFVAITGPEDDHFRKIVFSIGSLLVSWFIILCQRSDRNNPEYYGVNFFTVGSGVAGCMATLPSFANAFFGMPNTEALYIQLAILISANYVFLPAFAAVKKYSEVSSHVKDNKNQVELYSKLPLLLFKSPYPSDYQIKSFLTDDIILEKNVFYACMNENGLRYVALNYGNTKVEGLLGIDEFRKHIGMSDSDFIKLCDQAKSPRDQQGIVRDILSKYKNEVNEMLHNLFDKTLRSTIDQAMVKRVRFAK